MIFMFLHVSSCLNSKLIIKNNNFHFSLPGPEYPGRPGISGGRGGPGDGGGGARAGASGGPGWPPGCPPPGTGGGLSSPDR